MQSAMAADDRYALVGAAAQRIAHQPPRRAAPECAKIAMISRAEGRRLEARVRRTEFKRVWLHDPAH